MRRNFTNFRSANYRSSRGGKRKRTTPSCSFSRDVILLSGPDDEDVPRQGNRVFLQDGRHVIMAFPFRKEWTDLEVELKIRAAFQDIIPSAVDFTSDTKRKPKFLRTVNKALQNCICKVIGETFQIHNSSTKSINTAMENKSPVNELVVGVQVPQVVGSLTL